MTSEPRVMLSGRCPTAFPAKRRRAQLEFPVVAEEMTKFSVATSTSCVDGEWRLGSRSTAENCDELRRNTGNISNISLVVTEQPEESVRSRYESEGKRAPMQGASKGSFPTVQVRGYDGNVRIVGYLTAVSGQPHTNILIRSTDPDDTSVSVELPGGIQGVALVCDKEHSATFCNMTVRRLRKKDESTRPKRNAGQGAAKPVSPNDNACITYMAFLPDLDVPIAYTVSESFACVVQDEPAGIKKVFPTSGPAVGCEAILVGRLFKSGFIVRVSSADGWSADCEVKKKESNQNAAVIVFPPYRDGQIAQDVEVQVTVVTGPQRDRLVSQPASFTYKASEKEGSLLCAHCSQATACPQLDSSPPAMKSTIGNCDWQGLMSADVALVDQCAKSSSSMVDLLTCDSQFNLAMSGLSEHSHHHLTLGTGLPTLEATLDFQTSPLSAASLDGSQCLFEANTPDSGVGFSTNPSTPSAFTIGPSTPACPAPPTPATCEVSSLQQLDHEFLSETSFPEPLPVCAASEHQLETEQAWCTILEQVNSLTAYCPQNVYLRVVETMAQRRDQSLLQVYRKAYSDVEHDKSTKDAEFCKMVLKAAAQMEYAYQCQQSNQQTQVLANTRVGNLA